MPEQSEQWRDFLIRCQKDWQTGCGGICRYWQVEGTARRNGLATAGDVKIRFTNCTSEDHAKIYRLVHPYSDELVGMFVPFGRVAPELGQKLLRETVILDTRTNVPILSLQPFDRMATIMPLKFAQ